MHFKGITLCELSNLLVKWGNHNLNISRFLEKECNLKNIVLPNCSKITAYTSLSHCSKVLYYNYVKKRCQCRLLQRRITYKETIYSINYKTNPQYFSDCMEALFKH